jgi:hypothetical protein
VEIEIAHKCNHLFSAINLALDPTLLTTAGHTVNNDDNKATAILSNRSSRKTNWPSLTATARAIFGNLMPQYLNALTIAANEAIADTGATAIFIMDDAEVDDKRVATKPLKIKLPDGTTIWSTHVCDNIIT